MASTHLLYLSALRVSLYQWLDGDIQLKARFEHGEEGIAAFDAYMATLSGSDNVLHVLVDVVEESFQIDSIPFLRGKDRKALLQRRLAQRFRDASLAITSSLGYERTQRREERVLLSAFTNVEFLEPWLGVLLRHELAVSGLYSPGLLGPAIARVLAPDTKNLIVVSVQEAGLRQTFVEGGKLRFSRLSPLSAEDLADRERLSVALGTETGRMYQYLRATNVLGIDHPPIEVAIVAPPGQAESAQRYMPDLQQLHIKVLDQNEIAGRIGLRTPIQGGGAEMLFLALLARRRPMSQYAPQVLRKPHRAYQARVAVMLGGALIGAACLIASAATLWESAQLKKEIEEYQAQTASSRARFQEVEAGFPPLPTSRDKLRAAMQQYAALSKLPSGPERLSVELSRALDASPRVELQKMRWRLSATKEFKPAQTPQPGARYEMLEIDATLNGVPTSDYRAANMLVEDFVAELRKIPGVEIVQIKMPFETGSQESLSAEIGRTEARESLRFSVVLAREAAT